MVDDARIGAPGPGAAGTQYDNAVDAKLVIECISTERTEKDPPAEIAKEAKRQVPKVRDLTHKKPRVIVRADDIEQVRRLHRETEAYRHEALRREAIQKAPSQESDLPGPPGPGNSNEQQARRPMPFARDRLTRDALDAMRRTEAGIAAAAADPDAMEDEIRLMVHHGFSGAAAMSHSLMVTRFIRLLARASQVRRVDMSVSGDRAIAIEESRVQIEERTRAEEEAYLREPMPGETPCVRGVGCQGWLLRSFGDERFTLVRYKKDDKCVLCARYDHNKVITGTLHDPTMHTHLAYTNIVGKPGEYFWGDVISDEQGNVVVLHVDQFSVYRDDTGLRRVAQVFARHPSPSHVVGATSAADFH